MGHNFTRHKPMKTPTQQQPDPQLLARAHRAIRLLETRKKAVLKEHAERIKRLKNACDLIVNDSFESTLIDTKLTLDPDILSLIDSPDEGL
jgi:hypothetical protein